MFSAVEVLDFCYLLWTLVKFPSVYKQTSMGQVFDHSLRYKHSKLRAGVPDATALFSEVSIIFLYFTHTKRGLKKKKRKNCKTAHRMPSL